MTTLAIVLGLVLVGFVIGFTSCALSVVNRKKDDQVEFEILNNQNAGLRKSIDNYIDIISSLTGKVFDQQDAIDDLTAQIKDVKIVRTKPETFNLFTEDFIKNAEILAESNHELFMKCIDEILVDTYISKVLYIDRGIKDKLYRIKMIDSSFVCIDSVEKLVHYVKQSYDMKQLLKASKN